MANLKIVGVILTEMKRIQFFKTPATTQLLGLFSGSPERKAAEDPFQPTVKGVMSSALN